MALLPKDVAQDPRTADVDDVRWSSPETVVVRRRRRLEFAGGLQGDADSILDEVTSKRGVKKTSTLHFS